MADGVSAWSREGVDAGIFSRDLLSRVYRGVEQLTLAKRRVHLPEVLLTAYEGIREAKLRGSCTVLLGHVQGEMLNLLNLGDCAVLVLRPTPRLADYHGGTRTTVLRRVYQSSSMLHRQNMPLQLNSNDSDVWALEPFDLVSVRLRRGDVIIAGTDGLFDNVRSFELERMVLQQLKDSPGAGGGGAHKRARELADAIVTKAAKAARSMEMSEFSFAGKLDDIAVVVAIADHWTPAAVSTALLDNFYSQE